MKLKNMILCLLLSYTFTACIQDEALNSEADIETCTLEQDVLSRAPIIENSEVVLMVRPETDITKLSPKFTLTDGATIEPASGTMRNFEKSQAYSYVVTSQDGQWSKEYIVKVFLAYIPTDYHFENYRLDRNGNYYTFFEKDKAENEIMTWASGNSGFEITGEKDKFQFPTTSDKNGKNGDCAKLQTKLTNSMATLIGMPMAAGNLFTGNFKLDNIGDALNATKFGVPFYHEPTHFKGYYKYKAGEMFKEKRKDGNIYILVDVPGRKDMCNIYAVFYETDDNFTTLTGSNVNDNDNLHIISRADITDPHECGDWTEFNIPFVLLPGRTIDKDKLKAGKYNLAIIFSSSKDGDKFEGAPNSTLYIDEVEIDYEGKNK